MAASAAYSVNSSTPTGAVAVAASSTVDLALLSTSGVNTVAWSIVGNHSSGAVNPTITPAGSPSGATASFPMPAGAGQAYLVKCVVNGGVDANGDADAALTKQHIIGVNDSFARVPLATGETLERSATHGYTEHINDLATNFSGSAAAIAPCRLAATGNIANLSNAGANMDGTALVVADRVLLPLQTTTTQNGVYVVASLTPTVLTRASDFAAGASVQPGVTVAVQAGDAWQGSTWTLRGDGALTVDTDALPWVNDVAVVDLRWFGAVGDGVTDDTLAVQAAVDAAAVTAGIVLAARGSYRLTSTITVSSAVTIMGHSAAPPGGVQGYANAFPTFLHDFNGTCFLFNGAVGSVASSGGGLEKLRIVQVFGTAGTAYGSAVKVAGVDGSHRPVWCKFRLLVIEETGAGVWTWALEFDGATAALSDMYCGEITSHTANTVAQGAGAVRINGAQVTMYNCLHYLGERGVVMGDADECGSCQFSNVSVSGDSTFDNAHDITLIGGIWGDLTFTANVTGLNTILPGRLAGTLTNSADNAVGALYYDPTLKFQSQAYGAFRTTRQFSVPNNRWYLAERTTAGLSYPVLGLDGENSCRVMPFGESPIVLGLLVNSTSALSPGDVAIGKDAATVAENQAQDGWVPLIKANASDQTEIGDATHAARIPGGIRYGNVVPVNTAEDAITTNGASATTALTYTVADTEAVVHVVAVISCKKTSTGDTAVYKRAASFKAVGGTVTQVGATDVLSDHVDAALATCVATIDNSGDSVRVRVTGIGATDLVWSVAVQATHDPI
jgi:hypothetical protein